MLVSVQKVALQIRDLSGKKVAKASEIRLVLNKAADGLLYYSLVGDIELAKGESMPPLGTSFVCQLQNLEAGVSYDGEICLMAVRSHARRNTSWENLTWAIQGPLREIGPHLSL